MGVSSLDLRAIADALAGLARRSFEQRRELAVHEKRLALLESAVADSARHGDPPPLVVRRSVATNAEALTRSFEARLAARPSDDEDD
jgi:hypothetical protein